MHTVPVDIFIQFIVNNFLERKYPKMVHGTFWDPVYENDGLYLHFPLSIHNWNGNNIDFTEKHISLIFCGNTSVWYHVSDEYVDISDIDLSEFTNSSNHTDCWSTDGLNFLTSLYFEQCEELDKDKSPIKMRSENNLSDIAVEQCEIQYSRDRDSSYKYNLEQCKTKKTL